MSASANARAHMRSRAGYVEDGRTGRLTSTASGVFAVSETMLDTPAARLARRVRSTRRRRHRRRRDCMASSAGRRCWRSGWLKRAEGERRRRRGRDRVLPQAPVTWHNALTRRAPVARWWLDGARQLTLARLFCLCRGCTQFLAARCIQRRAREPLLMLQKS